MTEDFAVSDHATGLPAQPGPAGAPSHGSTVELGEPGSAWDAVIGQPAAVHTLRLAAIAARAGAEAGRASQTPAAASENAGSNNAMTHAWLFTGPPGSGRAAAARSFAAALQCSTPGEPGCGHCQDCHTALTGTHPDVDLVATEQLTIGVEQARGLVMGSAMSPTRGHFQVIVVEDAERLTEGAANVLLKAIEEPSPRTVWMLCAPSSRDLLPTILSRCRLVALRTPSPAAIAEALHRQDGVEPGRGEELARAAQGDIERARALALDPAAAARRAETLRLPREVGDIGRAFKAAGALVDAAAAEAKGKSELLDAKELEELKVALGYGQGKGAGSARGVSGSAGLVKELETKQKRRTTRLQRDALDRALVDIVGFYRDVLAIQFTAGRSPDSALIHADHSAQARTLAQSSSPEDTMRRIESVFAARRAIAANVAPLLALEAMALTLSSR
jgi:DNA polymerase III subunit delta'